MNGRFIIIGGIYRYASYLLNPALGAEEIELRTKRLAKAEKDRTVLEAAGGIAFGIAAIATVILLGTETTHPLAIVAPLLVMVGCIIVRARIESRTLAERTGWVNSGDAVCIDFISDFRRQDIPETDIWRAAHLFHRAKETASRAKWGRTAQREHRLPPGAEGALEDTVDSAALMYREVAAILDPGGTFTSAWLLEKVVP